MDEKTIIRDHGCSCDRNRVNCVHCIIERSGDLAAQRIEAENPGEELNLATLGIYRKPQTLVPAKKMKYIHIGFRTQEERVNFENRIKETKQIYNQKLHWYYKEMNIQQGDHNVSMSKTRVRNTINLEIRYRDSQAMLDLPNSASWLRGPMERCKKPCERLPSSGMASYVRAGAHPQDRFKGAKRS